MQKPPVLLLGLFDTAIMTARCFLIAKIPVYGLDYNTTNLGFVSRRIKPVVTPNPNNDEANWINFILNWLKNSSQKFVLIPTSDEFVYLCSKYSNTLSEFCYFVLPAHNVVEDIIERDRQFENAMKIGIKIPKFNTHSKQLPENFKFPVAIKPLNTTQWKRKLNNKGFVINEKDTYKKTVDLLKSKQIRYVVQEIIDGDNTQNFEVNLLYLPDNNLYYHTVRKIRQYPDRFGTATCIENFSNERVEQLAINYIKANSIYGFSNIEFKYNKVDNEYYYIETNTRVWLQVNFSMKLGLNFPLLYYKFLTRQQLDQYPINIQKGKWVDFLPDLLFWKKYKKKYQLTFFHFLKSWFPLIATSLFSITDPLPFITDLPLIRKLKKKNR